MSKTRDNHYVPQWHQRGFLDEGKNTLCYLDLTPDKKELPNGRIITFNDLNDWPTSRCFYQTDLYTTFFGEHINDDIETFLFGKIDDSGARAIRAFIDDDVRGWHQNFFNFFSYLDSQKIRTPKGLDWIRQHYPTLTQIQLMLEMQSIRNLNCALWTEGVREFVFADMSDIKFIISDHPVTIYNHAFPPESDLCVYPNDPPITLKATQTIFPLSKDCCLILTHLEYAKNPSTTDPFEKRTHSKLMRQSMVRTDNFIRSRHLNRDQVIAINTIIKRRAKRYIAAGKKEWFPENLSLEWKELGTALLPPEKELYLFGGEIYVGYKDGSTYYQDAYGRQHPDEHLKKVLRKKIGRNDPCGCGSGKKFKKCCEGKPDKDRPTWNVLSIRERNLVLYRGIYDILGFNDGKTWDDVRTELSDDQVARIHNLYWSLWPIETDIFSLLPKPDNTLRVVYTGLLDPRVIAIPLGATPYFDEILIQHPFTHPKAVNPEFSPTENPHKHKYQTLKNLLLFFYLEPFVRSGRVIFYPDPCIFDNYLHREMINMARGRQNKFAIDVNEEKTFFKLSEDDFSRTMRGLPKERLVQQIRQCSSDMSPEEIDAVAEYMKNQNDLDPLALLQDDLYTQGGQFTILSMSPNFEMALFTAQVTGSAIITDSPTRWRELNDSQVRINGITCYPWSEVSDAIAENEFVFCVPQNDSFYAAFCEYYGDITKAFRDTLNKTKAEDTSCMEIVRRLKKHIKPPLDSIPESVSFEDGTNIFKVRMKFVMPKGGYVNNNVQRLLLKAGSQHHLSRTPMAIFIEIVKDESSVGEARFDRFS